MNILVVKKAIPTSAKVDSIFTKILIQLFLSTFSVGGRVRITTKSWQIELNGQTEFMKLEGKKQTKIKMGKMLFTTSRNPGLHVKNRYGNNPYQHAEHWMDLGNI